MDNMLLMLMVNLNWTVRKEIWPYSKWRGKTV